MPFVASCRSVSSMAASIGDVDLIALDSLCEGVSQGALAPGTIDWLGKELDGLNDRPVVIALHHPPFDCRIPHMDKTKLKNASELLSIVGNHQAAHVIICGHVHRFICRHEASSPIMIGPSPAHAVSLDHRPDGAPEFFMETGGFLLHCFDSETSAFTSEYIPIGPFDGPFPFFADDRLGKG